MIHDHDCVCNLTEMTVDHDAGIQVFLNNAEAISKLWMNELDQDKDGKVSAKEFSFETLGKAMTVAYAWQQQQPQQAANSSGVESKPVGDNANPKDTERSSMSSCVVA